MLLKSGSDDQFKAIAVVGMAGVGKTTLCQEVFNKEEVKRHFVPRIWVCMSRQPNDDENLKAVIVKRMLECLGVDDEVINSIPKDHELVYALHMELMTKKYLIVLEDCEETDKWYEKLYNSSNNGEKWGEQLYHGFPKGYGGAVIVTSRNEEVAKKMVGEENLLQLQPLSNPESCWSIYKDSVAAEGVEFNPPDSKESKQLKEKLKTKCVGLPLAAKLMGQITADQQRNAAAQAQDAATKNTTTKALALLLLITGYFVFHSTGFIGQYTRNGETWMAREISECAVREGSCYEALWLSVTEKYDINLLYKSIAHQLSLSFITEEWGEEEEDIESNRDVKVTSITQKYKISFP
ncbi:hypothetical protein Dsin_024184 [Dipteronia sinensis]|uniref:NB-ARC domain-containing protein n=1 Tax=Dipteronia sinensis TaxID=43782 RepID=A0AAE0E1S4_9ROSI|nr:hypothetical protein Dsin_024184 [Dipteronia sinensis]